MHNREDLKAIAKENREIVKNGYYSAYGRKVSLPSFWDNYTSAIKVLTPENLKSMYDDEDELMMYYSVPDKHNIQIENCTSFEAAMLMKGDSTCVLNFANAVTPGGGYLNGASAQEEDLCRCSTLYQSLSSSTAREMYDYNRNNPSPKDSDYMIYSKNVTVFREPQYGFYDVPFKVSVLTAPAINRNGHGSVLSDEEVDSIMLHRIRLVLKAMAYSGHWNIVLGAWGCGAFGHKAEKVAGYFKSVLIDENMIEYFENVVFAVYEIDEAEPKTTAFRKVFDGYTCNDILQAENFEEKEFWPEKQAEQDSSMNFLQAEYPFPACNFKCDSDNNSYSIGYAQGIMSDGRPFVAELCRESDSFDKNMIIIVPAKNLFEEEIRKYTETEKYDNTSESNILFSTESVHCYYNAMEDIDDMYVIDNIDILDKFAQYFIKQGLFKYTDVNRNGALVMFDDYQQNKMIGFTVSLEINHKAEATTPINFWQYGTDYKLTDGQCRLFNIGKRKQ